MTALSQLQGLQTAIDAAVGPVEIELLPTTIAAALAVAAPDGSPDVISAQGNAYLQVSSTLDSVISDLQDVATNKLPTAWKGDVAETASQAVSALSAETGNASITMFSAGQALLSWAGDLQQAQREDRYGRDSLESACRSLQTSGWEQHSQAILAEAKAGIAAMVAAARLVQNSGQATAGTLNQLADQATAERLDVSGLDVLDAVVLANEQNESTDDSDILTMAELARASQLLDSMSAADRQGLEALLADAKSPEEAAFLMKALAAGNSLSAIKQFDVLIHPYGNDPAWLSQHLAPDLTDGTYDGVLWYQWPKADVGWGNRRVYDQGSVNDCVAAANVAALASLDPVFMLKLTTGDHPGVPGSDSVPAFVHRLQGEYISQYQDAQRTMTDAVADYFLPSWLVKKIPDPFVYPRIDTGFNATGENALANSNLGPATGLSYHHVSLNGSSTNQAVLPQVEQAVNAGVPVPLGIQNATGGGGHTVVIIGADNGNFAIYNPWGYTTWVPESQFASNQLGAVVGNNASASVTSYVELPSA
jgi:hypothetical protein